MRGQARSTNVDPAAAGAGGWGRRGPPRSALGEAGAVCSSAKQESASKVSRWGPLSRWQRGKRPGVCEGPGCGPPGRAHTPPPALTTSELKGFGRVLRLELLLRDQTLVLCLKAALTLERRRWHVRTTSEADSVAVGVHCGGSLRARADVKPRGPGAGEAQVQRLRSGVAGSLAGTDAVPPVCGAPCGEKRLGLGPHSPDRGMGHTAVSGMGHTVTGGGNRRSEYTDTCVGHHHGPSLGCSLFFAITGPSSAGHQLPQ